MNEDHSYTAEIKRRDPFLAWLREQFTPLAVWRAIGILGSAIAGLVFAIAYVLNAQNDLHRHQESITGLQQEHAQDRELLQQIVTGQAVMNGKVDSIAVEVDRQREWRERIEDVAEAPPHARRRR